MRKRIINKMTDHVESILEKDEISSEDYAKLQSFLCLLDMEKARKKAEEDMARNEEKMKTLVGLAFGRGD